MSDGTNDYILLTAYADKALTYDEIKTVENFLKTESGISDALVEINTR